MEGASIYVCLCSHFLGQLTIFSFSLPLHTHMRSVQEVSSQVMWKIETFIEEDRRDKKHCTYYNDAKVPFKIGPWDLTQFYQWPSAALLYFPESHQWSEIFFLSKVILVLGKPEVGRRQTGAVGGLSHLGDLKFRQKTLHKMWCMNRSWWSCQ